MGKRRPEQSGFTIVELVTVIVIIVILATIGIVVNRAMVRQAHEAAAKTALQKAVDRLTLYATTNSGRYPADKATAGLEDTDDVTYTYVNRSTESSRGYCLVVIQDRTSYFQTNLTPTPAIGNCIDLVAWWPFNGNANDISGNGINGTVVGATPATGAKGEAGTAYQLGPTNQYISIGSPAALSTLPATGFTYSVWLAQTGTSPTQWPQIMGASDTHRDFGIRANNYGARAYFERGEPPYSGTTFRGLGGANFTELNTWRHIAVTYSPTANETDTSLLFYVDGVLVGADAGPLRSVMAPLFFTTPTSGWRGKVDDARIYARPLVAGEIKMLYDQGAQ